MLQYFGSLLRLKAKNVKLVMSNKWMKLLPTFLEIDHCIDHFSRNQSIFRQMTLFE